LNKTFFSLIIVGILIFSSLLVFPVSSDLINISSSSNTWYVDDDGTADFTKIQDAINASSNGDTIFVHNGTYNENLMIDKSITLHGQNKNNTIINGKIQTHTIEVFANNVVISTFLINNDFDEKSIQIMNCNTVKIENNFLNEDLKLLSAINIKILNNSVYKIRLSSSNNNTIKNNVFHSEGYLSFVNSSHNIIKYNLFNNNPQSGSIAIINPNSYSHGNKISYNVIKGCYKGISLYSVNNEVSNNDFFSCTFPGWIHYQGRCTWKNNYYNRPMILPKFLFGFGGYPGEDADLLDFPIYFDFDWRPAVKPNCDFDF
jgi:parallel beta-helix repeat protein